MPADVIIPFSHIPRAHICVLAIDPGVTTGWCQLIIPASSMFPPAPSSIRGICAGEIRGDETAQVKTICQYARDIGGLSGRGPAIACEDFQLRGLVSTSRDVLAPVRIAAKLDYAIQAGHAGDNSHMPPMAMPSEAKGTITDERLKKWDMWIPGSAHKRDALRHALLCLRRAKDDPAFRELCWPGLVAP